MGRIEGVVEARTEKEGGKLKIAGIWYDITDTVRMYAEKIVVGDRVAINTVRDKAITFIEKIEAPKQNGQPQGVKHEDAPGYWEQKFQFDIENSKRISRQACLNTATKIVELGMGGVQSADQMTTDAVEKKVISVAERLETWVRR